MKLDNRFNIFLIVLVGIIVYGNIFMNDFVWDDHIYLLNNLEIKSLENVPKFFVSASHGNIYRPLRNVLYSVVFSLSAQNTFFYHFNSLFWHLLSTILVYFILLKIIKSKTISLISALFFVTHPVHTGRVTNITAGFDLLGIFLFLLSFYLYIEYFEKKNKKYLLSSFIVFIFGLFSSEEAITLPIIMFFYYMYFITKEKNIIKNFSRWTTKFYFFIISLIIFLFIRFNVLGSVGRTTEYIGGNFYFTILTMTKVILKYILLLFWPVNLTLEYVVPIEKGLSLAVISSVIFILLFLFLAIYLYKKNQKIISFFMLWFFITLIPFSNIFPLLTFMAERYLYLPSLGFCFLLGLFIFNFKKLLKNKKTKNNIAITLAVLILLFYSITTIKRNTEWKDDLTLWTRTIETMPQSSRAYDNLGFAYERQGDFDEAIKYSGKAVELDSKNHFAYYNLGVAYAEKEDYALALESFNSAVELKPDYFKAYDYMALIDIKQKNITLALDRLKKSLSINPNGFKAYNYLGMIASKTGNFDEAEQYFKKSIELNPWFDEAYYNLGILYEFLGESDKATQYVAKALELKQSKEYQEKMRSLQ